MSQVFFVSYSKIARISRHLGWDMLDSDLLSDFQVDFPSVCIIYNWLRVRLRIAHLAQDSRFACIGLADDQDAKLRALGTDFCCIFSSLPKRKGVTRQLNFFVYSQHGRRGGMHGEYED